MKLGYPCINRSINCTSNHHFKLTSYSPAKLKGTIGANLDCLEKTIEFNKNHSLLFFRIGSPLIPFAAHPICKFNWQHFFKKRFKKIGAYLKMHYFRISLHPGQFVLLNSTRKEMVRKSIKDLEYHCDLLDLLNLDRTAKVQIHIGGVYGDRESAMKRFVAVYKKLPEKIKKRLVIENDHLHYSLKDCLYISQKTNLPVVFDILHHQCLNNGEKIRKAIIQAMKTWGTIDGKLMVDYSNQKINAKKGNHAESIDLKKFRDFLAETKGLDFDIMLEIKDKEKSALKALKVINKEHESSRTSRFI